jgi:hypothetical protein
MNGHTQVDALKEMMQKMKEVISFFFWRRDSNCGPLGQMTSTLSHSTMLPPPF